MAASSRHPARLATGVRDASLPAPDGKETRMLKVWGRTSSSNVMKVLFLCEELGIPYERVDAGGEFGRTKEPFYLAMNPNSRVPTIEDDGYSLWESNSILRYLVATRAPGHAIHPTDPKRRGDVERWMDWQLASLSGPMTPLFFTYVRTPEAQRDHAAAAKARDEAEALWRMVDARIGAKNYVAADHLTLADIVLAPYAHRWFQLPIQRAELANLARWYATLRGHAGCAKHVFVEMR
jgi:glutathione S-transferase